MRVLQTCRYYPPHTGGVERVVENIAEGLQDEFDFDVLCANHDGRGRRERIDGVDITRATSLGELYSVPISPTYPVQFVRLARHADIVHHHLPNPLGVFSSLLSVGGDHATVITYHSDIVRQDELMTIYRPLLYSALSNADRIFVTSPRLIETSEHLKEFKSKCLTVPLSVDVERNRPNNSERFNIPFDNDLPLVLFVGRLNYYKGVEYLIDAFENVDANLLIAGDGKHRSNIEHQVRELDIGDKVEVVGYVPDERLQFYYRAADVFVLPSIEPSEAFGIVQLEAMLRGTPVINTNLSSGVPWVSKHEETGLTVPPRDSTALAEAIRTLVEDKARRRKYGANAVERVKSTFGRRDRLNSITEIYRDL
ncbi:group 1 glycosyl transferase [Halorubrum californiense DSM 19288]|uniref:Group 1 glycosyl transferase n=1 Tax=Halorubrum californiense DSM 19288 TaxID=1227465 RepID=M0E2K0_9EURY|nr:MULTISPECIES: glycosyltransferase [Halorubrum]ELZ40559.1 group 1 glycosyl transferase [Halorubrum californiense DSM 19288]TKX72844.1 glycosyltransferase [Halorubrum sp. GN11GM_10-3_MGM]